MNIIAAWWHKICEPLDGFLWHRDISHPVIRPLLRNEILACGLCLLAGGALYAIVPWLFWFGCGLGCMTWIFWSWARFFLRLPPGEYSAAFLRAIFLRFALRLFLLALLLYVALAIFRAPAGAILAGLAAGVFLGLASFALNMAGPRGN